jgi:predicted secreted protein
MTMRRAFVILAVALIIVPAAGAARVVTVGIKSNGKSVSLNRGDTLVVVLAANGTTGFAWAVKSYDKRVLTMVGTSYKGENGPPGHPGTYTLRMSVKAVGRTTLRLVYRQAWDKKTPPAKTFTLKITVR